MSKNCSSEQVLIAIDDIQAAAEPRSIRVINTSTHQWSGPLLSYLDVTSQRSHAVPAIEYACRDINSDVVVAAIDLYKFSDINSAFNHQMGDQIIGCFAQNLRSLRTTGAVAHIGCDKFAVILPCHLAPSIDELAAEIVDLASAPFQCGNIEALLGASVGFSRGPADQAAQVFEQAEIALSAAKRSGRNEWRIYSTRLHDQARNEQLRRDALLRALAHEEFFAVYQPQTSIETGEIVGAEALIRWGTADGIVHSPSAFLRAAEEMNIVHELDARLLSRVARDLAELNDRGIRPPRTSCNVSLSSLTSKGYKSVASSVAASGHSICLELVEQIMFEELTAEQREAIVEFKKLGFSIGIDDFGTGHASFVALFSLAPDVVKIDRSMLPSSEADQRRKSALTSIVSVCRSYGTKVVAEGVETEDQLEACKDAGCHVIQGYLRFRPMNFQQYTRVLSKSTQENLAK